MKKFISILAVTLCLGMLAPIASAADVSTISEGEKSAVATLMNNRGMDTEQLEVEVLYDGNDIPAFLIGTTEDHYLIMNREQFDVLESGEGNPYNSVNDTAKKYYGGLLQYFIEEEAGYKNILTSEEENQLPTTDFIAQINTDSSVLASEQRDANLLASVTKTETIPSYTSGIRQKAFGYNDDNTCTAVALSLVLNYLDIEYDDGIVPSNMELENIAEEVPNNANVSYVEDNYPRANRFHRTLVEDCGLGAASYADAVIAALNVFSDEYMDGVDVSVLWNLSEIPNNYVVASVDDDMPAMVTYTFFGDYKFHTMPAYGYRLLSDGSKEYLVHTGWYSSMRNETQMPMVWAPEQAITYLYKFTIE